MRIRIDLCIAILFLLAATPSFAKISGQPDPVMTQRFTQERSAHVGEVLPSRIKLALDDGRIVDVREHLQGPVIVLKIPVASVTQGLLAAVREAGGKSLDATRANIAVITVTDKDHKPLDLPESVLVFRTESALEDGFFGGHILPTTFYFDQDLRLIKRHPGMSMDPKSPLHFPQ